MIKYHGDMIKEYSRTDAGQAQKEVIKEWMNANMVLEKAEKHVVITHAQLMTLPEEIVNKYELIIDEDYLYTGLRSMGAITAEDVQRLIEAGYVYGEKQEAFERMMKDRKDDYFRKKHCSHEDYLKQEDMWKLDIQGDVNGFLDADVYHYAVSKDGDKFEYFKKPQMPKTKVIIMSATLQEDMYRCFFRDRQIVMYDIPKVRYQGKLIQYANYSMSRNDIDRHCSKLNMPYEDFYRYIMDFCGDFYYGITFMKNEKCMGNEVLHFGNAVGVDKYKGKNGLIIGTQHLDENSYKLAAFCLGINVKEYKLERCRVTFGGYEFPMNTYDNPVLRMIQLYLISSEMEQCIGRSRLLRTDAVVYLFSNFPCEQTEIRFDDYLKEKYASVPEGTPAVEK